MKSNTTTTFSNELSLKIDSVSSISRELSESDLNTIRNLALRQVLDSQGSSPVNGSFDYKMFDSKENHYRVSWSLI